MMMMMMMMVMMMMMIIIEGTESFFKYNKTNENGLNLTEMIEINGKGLK